MTGKATKPAATTEWTGDSSFPAAQPPDPKESAKRDAREVVNRFKKEIQEAVEKGQTDPLPKREIERLRRDCAELYQVLGTLDELVPEIDKAVVVKALDNASAAAAGEPRPHDDLLPFILKCLSNNSSIVRPAETAIS